jgi:thymidylate synthase ThyX
MPEIRELAQQIRLAMAGSTPNLLKHGEWHLPYVNEYPSIDVGESAGVRLSVARCARVSYLTQDGRKPDVHEDLALYDRLASQVPLHASPCEHQATPDEWKNGGPRNPKLHGNLKGWIQYRKTLPGECQ